MIRHSSNPAWKYKEQSFGIFRNSKKAFRSKQNGTGNELITENSRQGSATEKHLDVIRKSVVATKKTKSKMVNFAAEVHRTLYSVNVIAVGRSK
jgi:hypothetical protein